MGTEEKIVQAALDVMSTMSIDTLTVRDIAARAGVNVATVHYYFRTKEAVVAEGLRQFFRPVMNFLQESLELDLPPREKLLRFLTAYMRQFYSHPGVFTSLMEAIVSAGLHQQDPVPNMYQKVLLETIGGVKHKMLGLVKEISGLEDEKMVVFKTIQMMTSVLHPLLISSLPKALFQVDFTDENTRLAYLKNVIASLDAVALPGHF